MLTNSRKDGFDRSIRFETTKMGSLRPRLRQMVSTFQRLEQRVRSTRSYGKLYVGSGRRNRKLKEMEALERQKEIEIQQQQRPVVNLVTPVDILSRYSLRIKSKYREEDKSFPIQTLAKVLENTG